MREMAEKADHLQRTAGPDLGGAPVPVRAAQGGRGGGPP
jgi:hypothetical protein